MAERKFTRHMAKHNCMDHKAINNRLEELKPEPTMNKTLKHCNWFQQVNRMQGNRPQQLQKVTTHIKQGIKEDL